MNNRRALFSILVVLILLLIAGGVFYIDQSGHRLAPTPTETPKNNTSSSSQDKPLTEVIAENLSVPWDITFLPNNDLLITERSGIIKRVFTSSDLHVQTVFTVSDVLQTGEGGLQGITLHPNFSENNNVYIYYTYSENGGNTLNRVVRYTYQDNTFLDPQIIVDAIPGASNHDGGRLRFGPDEYLYITTGDAQIPSAAQDRNSLAGKILRVRDDGSPAPENIFGTQVFSYGHRNPQGLTWTDEGVLFATEHGRSGIQSGLDEINQIQNAGNYGWPMIQGNETQDGMISPVINSGNTTWAPAGIAYNNGALYFGGLRGEALYKAPLEDNTINEVIPYFQNQFGRIRAVVSGPDGLLYISTSNRDGRGSPNTGDDKIIRINPEKL